VKQSHINRKMSETFGL